MLIQSSVQVQKQIMRVLQTLCLILGSRLATLKQQLQPGREMWVLQMCTRGALLAPTSTTIGSHLMSAGVMIRLPAGSFRLNRLLLFDKCVIM